MQYLSVVIKSGKDTTGFSRSAAEGGIKEISTPLERGGNGFVRKPQQETSFFERKFARSRMASKAGQAGKAIIR